MSRGRVACGDKPNGTRLRHVTPKKLPTADELAALPLNERIAKVVDHYAPKKGDRQDHFAGLIGSSRKSVGRWVHGEGEPNARSAAKIADKTALPVELFLPDDEPEPENGEVATPKDDLLAIAVRLEAAVLRIERHAQTIAEAAAGSDRVHQLRAPKTRQRAGGQR